MQDVIILAFHNAVCHHSDYNKAGVIIQICHYGDCGKAGSQYANCQYSSCHYD